MVGGYDRWRVPTEYLWRRNFGEDLETSPQLHGAATEQEPPLRASTYMSQITIEPEAPILKPPATVKPPGKGPPYTQSTKDEIWDPQENEKGGSGSSNDLDRVMTAFSAFVSELETAENVGGKGKLDYIRRASLAALESLDLDQSMEMKESRSLGLNQSLEMKECRWESSRSTSIPGDEGE